MLQLLIASITINISLDGQAKFSVDITTFFSWFGYFLLINTIIYSNLYILAPRYLEREKYNRYLAGVIGLVLFTLSGITLLQALLYDFKGIEEIQDGYLIAINLISSTLSISLMIAGTSTLLLLRHQISHTRRIDELEAHTLQMELKQLKRQINPHFLFNMLNNANALMRKNPDEAAQLLFKLEDLLHYQLNDSTREHVLLSSDIRFLSDFLNLEKVRRDAFEYTITTEGDINRIFLPPLLFIPFVENAVKHNFDSEHTSYVHLVFQVQEDTLLFQCVNSKPGVPDSSPRQTGGLGLANIKRRLELLYPAAHTLELEESDSYYKVNLSLPL